MKAQMELNGHYKEDYVMGIQVQPYPSGILKHEICYFFYQPSFIASESGFICILIFSFVFGTILEQERNSFFCPGYGSKELYEALASHEDYGFIVYVILLMIKSAKKI